MRASGGDSDTELRIQLVAGLALGAFAAEALVTALLRGEVGLTVGGAVAAVLAVALVALAVAGLRRHRDSAERQAAADDSDAGGSAGAADSGDTAGSAGSAGPADPGAHTRPRRTDGQA
ncbi:hypothetical protein GCM10027570_52400 [Streptomonospora sediminis]